MENNIMVSVCMITYNHEKYISQAIDGILMQKTDFPIELIIGEDCSTDNTRKICIEYKEKYPDKIKLLLPDNNLGMTQNFIATLQTCTGKYIALCEGDDYWTDPYKLQKQVDFLESDKNQDYVICAHNSVIKSESSQVCTLFNQEMLEDCFNFEDIIIKNWFVPTASMIFRKSELDKHAFKRNFFNGDYYLQLTLLSNDKKMYYTNEVMSVYREHEGGAAKRTSYIDVRNKIIELLNYMNYYTNKMYNLAFQEKIMRLQNEIVKWRRERKHERTFLYRLKYKMLQVIVKILFKSPQIVIAKKYNY